MFHQLFQRTQLFLRVFHDHSFSFSDHTGKIITVLTGPVSLHQFMPSVHFKSYLWILPDQIQFLSFLRSVKIQGQYPIFQTVSVIDVSASLIRNSKPADLAAIQHFPDLFYICDFPFFSSHFQSPPYSLILKYKHRYRRLVFPIMVLVDNDRIFFRRKSF